MIGSFINEFNSRIFDKKMAAHVSHHAHSVGDKEISRSVACFFRFATFAQTTAPLSEKTASVSGSLLEQYHQSLQKEIPAKLYKSSTELKVHSKKLSTMPLILFSDKSLAK